MAEARSDSILLLAPHLQYSAIVLSTLLCSAATVAVASRLNRGYVQTLERNLRGRAVELDLSEVQDLTTRTMMLNTISGVRAGAAGSRPDERIGERF